MTMHKQVPFVPLYETRKKVTVDEGVLELMNELKRLGVETHYSCQGGDEASSGRAYFLARGWSLLPVLTSIYWRYLTFRLSRGQRATVKCFTHGLRAVELCWFTGKGTYVRPINQRAKWRFCVGDDEIANFRITLLWSNAYGFRITIRWPLEETERMTEFVRSL